MIQQDDTLPIQKWNPNSIKFEFKLIHYFHKDKCFQYVLATTEQTPTGIKVLKKIITNLTCDQTKESTVEVSMLAGLIFCIVLCGLLFAPGVLYILQRVCTIL